MFNNEQLNKIRCVPITVILAKQGYQPAVKRAKGIWYKAPWREETEPSLKVSPELNVWFDFGANVGGDCIALVEFQHSKPFTEACELIQSMMDGLVFDSTPIQLPSHSRPRNEHTSYTHIEEREIEAPSILRYLEDRRISKEIAERYCCELHYGRTPTEHFYSLAFKTGVRSYELRNRNFKGCIGPKCIAIIKHDSDCANGESESKDKQAKACVVFEGFFNMLSYVQLLNQGSDICILSYPCDMVVLNSAGLASIAQPILDEYDRSHCYLDNDMTGSSKTREIIDHNPDRATDESHRYNGYNDLNDYLCGRMQ